MALCEQGNTQVIDSLKYQMGEIVGDNALIPQHRLSDYSVDGHVPSVAVLPSSTEAVSQILSAAGRQGQKVTPWGGGTQIGLGNAPHRLDIVLSIESLDQVLAHEPADLTVTVQAGVRLAHLQQQLGLQGQFLPIQAPLPSRATIGGILATNASGPVRLAYGTARDWLIGLSVARSDGTLTKSGGRVVKNVTGYDLNKLYTGSLGTLGVNVEATFKLSPLPVQRATLFAGFAALEPALAASGVLLDQPFSPSALHVLSGDIINQITPGSLTSHTIVLLVMYSGRAHSVKKCVGSADAVLRSSGATATAELDVASDEAVWQAIVDLGWSPDQHPQLGLKVMLPPSAVSSFLREALAPSQPWPIPAAAIDPGYGMVRLIWPQVDGEDSSSGLDIQSIVRRLRDQAQQLQGHVVVERCPPAAKNQIDVWDEQVDGLAVMRRVKEQLDPDGILNPGRFIKVL